MDTASDGRSISTDFWDLSNALQSDDRLSAVLVSLSVALTLPGRLKPLRLSLEVKGQPEVVWPKARLPSETARRAATEALQRARPALAGHLPGHGTSAQGPTAIAIPIAVPDDTTAVLTLEAEIADPEALSLAMATLSLAMGWIPATLLAGRRSDEGNAEHSALLSLRALTAFVAHRRFSEAARALMTHLADRYGCDRVALGLTQRARVRLEAISHTGTFSRALGLSRRIQAAMEEAFDQERVIHWPLPPGEQPDLVVTSQADLVAGVSDRCVLSVPLFDGTAYRGVILFERTGRHFGAEELRRIEALCGLMTPILLEKRENDRWLALRAAKSVQRLAHQTFGRSHLVIKVSILSVLLMMGALLVLHGDRTVVAEAVVQGSEIRTIAAPFAGFIAEAPFREGDTVSRGDLLVRLDDRDFMLELTRLTAVRGQTELELDKAMSEHNRSEAALAESRIRQNDAEIALTQQQIARSKIIATFDGTVISGDLSNNIGGSVDQGQPLLVVAPLTDFRVDLMVPEDAVDKIKADQSAALKVAPLPERSFALTLRQTMPVARYENGQTRYQVEGRFVTRPEGLVPGMTGIARISLGRASLAELWLGPIVDRLRLWFWRNVAI